MSDEIDHDEVEMQELLGHIDEQFALLQKRQDAQEELIANLILAYTEVTSAVETTIAELMSPRSEEDREAFRKTLSQRHLETMKMIQEVNRDVAANREEDPSAAILRMVGEQSSYPPKR